jgi:probable HAF family extracellular repeat protein
MPPQSSTVPRPTSATSRPAASTIWTRSSGHTLTRTAAPHGYIFDSNSGTYTILDDPFGAGGTFASGINERGWVVGSYRDADNLSGHYHGFLYNGRTYTTLDDPLGTGSSYAYALNGAGLVVGRYIDHTGMHGFLYNPNGGTYTTLDDPLADNDTQAYGINSAGLVVGIYFQDSDTPHGFLYNPNGATYTTLDDPLAASGFDNPFGPSGTLAEGINAAGEIVGYYADSNGDERGFLYNGGVYTTIDDPGAFDTYAFGINKNGHVVGVRLDKFGDRGFLETPVPNPPPPGGTTADMILRGANGSPSAGQYEIYDIGNNSTLAAYSLAEVGTDWQFAGLGRFFGSDTTDLVLRNVNTGAFEVYDISSNTITSFANLGQVGLDWQLGGLAVDPPIGSAASTDDIAQLAQAMAGFGGDGAGDDLAIAALASGTSPQDVLAMASIDDDSRGP